MDEIKWINLIPLFIAFCVSFALATVLVLTQKIHEGATSDSLEGIQKVHTKNTSRIGGLALIFGVFSGLLFLLFRHFESDFFFYFLASLFAFVLGFLEDIVKRVSPWVRLFGAVFSAFIATVFMNLLFSKVGYAPLDAFLFEYQVIALLLAVFFISSMIHAYNVIDGYNGLMLLFALVPQALLLFLSFRFGDFELAELLGIQIAAILGLFLWNFPLGKIFSGDGGAYFMGASCSILGLYFINRHALSVSPWLLSVLFAYPAWELAFSIARKYFEKSSPLHPDQFHLHLMLLPWFQKKLPNLSRNTYHGIVVSVLFVFFLPIQVLGLFFYQNTLLLLALFSFQVAIYLLAYAYIRMSLRKI